MSKNIPMIHDQSFVVDMAGRTGLFYFKTIRGYNILPEKGLL
jgi:hypothetical protein